LCLPKSVEDAFPNWVIKAHKDHAIPLEQAFREIEEAVK
jgi:hypothetical protein